MLVTENEAREKWCPLAFEHKYLSHNGDEGYVANTRNGQPMRMCIGSRCMMWRFAAMPEYKTIRHKMTEQELSDFWEKDLPDPERPDNVPAGWTFSCENDGCYWCEDDAGRAARQKGYCALTGRLEAQPCPS